MGLWLTTYTWIFFWDVDYRKIGKYFCEKLNGVSIKELDTDDKNNEHSRKISKCKIRIDIKNNDVQHSM